MTSNLRGLLRRATPMTEEEVEEFINADMAANAHRYPNPPQDAICMEDDGVHGATSSDES